MFLGRIGGLEAQRVSDLGTRRRRSGLRDRGLDELQDLLLAGGELGREQGRVDHGCLVDNRSGPDARFFGRIQG